MNLKLTLTFTEVFSSKDVSEECVMHAKSDKMKVTAFDKANEAIELLFHSRFWDVKLD